MACTSRESIGSLQPWAKSSTNSLASAAIAFTPTKNAATVCRVTPWSSVIWPSIPTRIAVIRLAISASTRWLLPSSPMRKRQLFGSWSYSSLTHPPHSTSFQIENGCRAKATGRMTRVNRAWSTSPLVPILQSTVSIRTRSEKAWRRMRLQITRTWPWIARRLQCGPGSMIRTTSATTRRRSIWSKSPSTYATTTGSTRCTRSRPTTWSHSL